MTTLREAAQQALEALQAHGSHAPNCDYLVLLTSLPPQRKPCSCGLGANITALRAALAHPPQRKALDKDALIAEFCNTPDIHQFVSAFVAGARYAERVHGIGGKDD